MTPDVLLLAGATPWRLAAVLVLALALLGALVALRVQRAPVADLERRGLLAHVTELRRRVLWCVAAWTAGTMAAFSFRLDRRPWGWMPEPALHDTFAAQTYRALARHLVPEGVQLVVLRPLDGFSAEFTVAMGIGFAVALPIVLLHASAFVGPALRSKEKRALRFAVLPALTLFALGATFAYTILAPLILDTLYGYPKALGAAPFLLVDELVSFTMTLVLVFGVAALTPVAMAGLSAAGLVGWRGFLRVWRHAVLAIVILCAFVTDGTLVTLALVAAPLIGFYFAGVGLAAWAGRGRPVR